MIKIFLAIVVITFVVKTVNSQAQLIWEDQGAILSKSAEDALVKKLAENEIEVVVSMDYKKRCEYHYAELTKTVSQVSLKIYDCNRNITGARTWTTKFYSMPEDEQVSRLVFAISEIVFETNPSAKTDRSPDDFFSVPFNHHATRHFFSPTSFNLKKGELYYSTIFFMMHDFQYGISDNFSLGMGTTSILHPFYITPKFSYKVNEKNSFSVGTMFMLGTWWPDFIGNLGYVTYTYGDEFNNVTLGLGHLYLDMEENVGRTVNEPVLNLSGMFRLSDHVYIVSENYYFGFNENADIYMNNIQLPPINNIRTNYIAGMFGFRFVSKSKDVRAIQFGLAYFQRYRQLPSQYNNPNFNVEYGTGDLRRLVLPTLTFYTKLGRRV